ncbi:MAG TPA: VOC family protein [Geothrix sp.]|nr:VOC family protein [Geothrix sp.]
MPEPQFAPIGHFCWPELATTDIAAAKAYYGALFGWSFFDVPSAMGNYTLFRVGDLDAAAGYQMGPQQSAPPHWNSYVAVESVDRSCAKAQELDAQILMAPTDIPDVGRMAFLRDPDGASLALWQSGKHHGAGIFGRPGGLCWTELYSRDTAGSIAFYTELFGWRAITKNDFGMTYTEFHAGDAPIGGMMGMEGPAWEGVPSAWMPYIAVADADAAAAAVHRLGGACLVPPKDIPTVGRFGIAKDPQGAVIAFIKLLER